MQGLLEDYSKLIYSVANKFNYQNKEDLYQVGAIALLNAHKNYKDNFDTKFSTYAYYYILGDMAKYVRDDENIKVSKDIKKLQKKIEEVRLNLSQIYMKEATIKELALFLEMSEERVSEILLYKNNFVSLDEPVNLNGNNSYYDVTLNKDEFDQDMLIDLTDAIETLNPLEKEIINYRFFNDLTQQEVATKVGMSQVQVYRNERKILSKLYNNLYQ